MFPGDFNVWARVMVCVLAMASPLLASHEAGAQPTVTRATVALIEAVAVPGPARPAPTTALKAGVAKELWDNPSLRDSYAQLAANKKPYDWNRAIEELDEAKAVWCLASGLSHPNMSVRLRCARALMLRRNNAPVRFVLRVADAAAMPVEGAGAAEHAELQHALANALNAMTDQSITLNAGQDPDGLRAGIPLWKQALRTGIGGPERSARTIEAVDALKTRTDLVVFTVAIASKPNGQRDSSFPHSKVVLSVPELPADLGANGTSETATGRLSLDQAAELIEAMADDGFFEVAQPRWGERKDRHCRVEIRAGEGEGALVYCVAMDWKPTMLRTLDAACEALDGESSQTLEKTLAPLGPQRAEWEKQVGAN